MANRQISQNTPRWPAVAALADLPNVAGSPTQNPALEAGDTCYLTPSDLLYLCLDPTLGAAVWAVLGPRDHQAPSIIVGNATAGDTTAVCDFLDPGDGSGITAALAYSATLPYTRVDIHVRPGEYLLPAVSSPFTVPTGVAVHGAGVGRTIIQPPSGSAGVEPWRTFVLSGELSGVTGMTFRPSGFVAAGASGSMSGVVTINAPRCFAHDLELDLDTYAPFTISTTFWATLVHIAMPSVDYCDIRNLVVNASVAHTVTASFLLNAVGSRTTATYDYLGQTPMPVIRNVRMHGRHDAATLYYVPVYMRAIVAFDLCGVWAANCAAAVSVLHRNGQSLGPRISDVTYYTATDFTQGVVVACDSLDSADWLENIHIDSVRAYWSGGTGWTHFPVSIFHYNTSVTAIRNIILANIQAQRTAADGIVRLELFPQNTGVIQNCSLQSIRFPDTNSLVVIGANAGAAIDTHVEQAHVAEIRVNVNATDTILANSRLHNTLTDLGTGTSQSNLIIGP